MPSSDEEQTHPRGGRVRMYPEAARQRTRRARLVGDSRTLEEIATAEGEDVVHSHVSAFLLHAGYRAGVIMYPCITKQVWNSTWCPFCVTSVSDIRRHYATSHNVSSSTPVVYTTVTKKELLQDLRWCWKYYSMVGSVIDTPLPAENINYNYLIKFLENSARDQNALIIKALKTKEEIMELWRYCQGQERKTAHIPISTNATGEEALLEELTCYCNSKDNGGGHNINTPARLSNRYIPAAPVVPDPSPPQPSPSYLPLEDDDDSMDSRLSQKRRFDEADVLPSVATLTTKRRRSRILVGIDTKNIISTNQLSVATTATSLLSCLNHSNSPISPFAVNTTRRLARSV